MSKLPWPTRNSAKPGEISTHVTKQRYLWEKKRRRHESPGKPRNHIFNLEFRCQKRLVTTRALVSISVRRKWRRAQRSPSVTVAKLKISEVSDAVAIDDGADQQIETIVATYQKEDKYWLREFRGNLLIESWLAHFLSPYRW